MQKLFKRSLAMVLALMMVLTMFAGAMAEEEDSKYYDTQFRSFDKQKQDYNFEGYANGIMGIGHSTNKPAEGTGYMYAQVIDGFTVEELHHYVYAYFQNAEDDENGINPDGCTKLEIKDIDDLYIAFDFYVSDASVVNGTTGDCGLGVDTVEGGGKESWGNTFIVKREVVSPVLKTLKDGWNHIVLPLSFKTAELKEKLNGTTVTVTTLRFHIIGLAMPAGFITAVDDIRFMNGAAKDEILPQRNAAKDVSLAIYDYDADNGTYEDFYKIYVPYSVVGDEYKAIVGGWDEFIADKEEWLEQAEADMAEDQLVADEVADMIKDLPADITVDDEAAIQDAQDAFDNLSEAQQILVGNVNITALENAQNALKAAQKVAADKAAAAAVDAMIEALPTPTDVTVDDEEDVKAARAAYKGLTSTQKEYVEGLETLEAVEAALTVAKDKAAAAAVDAMIEALPTPTDVTVEDADAINAAKAAYNALTVAQKEYVALADKLSACVDKLEELSNIEPEPEIKMGDLDGDEKIDAKDALVALKIAVQKVSPTDVQTVAGDVDKNGKIDAVDALEMLKFAVEKPSVLDQYNPAKED